MNQIVKTVFALMFILSFGCLNNASSNHRTKLDTLPNGILGKWGGLGESTPVFDIRNDSIYYFQEQKAYPYKMKANDMLIERNNEIGVLKNISVDLDTLIFYDELG
ncbi:MAG TPA: hypothetical protein VNT20_16230 [Flavisolibacter sp.]|jgi:hypothetical protein|nr:hypothetical protein [Flavisolibacter sp.]